MITFKGALADEEVPLLTLAQVRAWERRATQIDDQLRELTNERDALARKLDAARVFMPAKTEERPVQHEATTASVPETDDNLPEAVLEAVAYLGDAPAPKAIRRRVALTHPALTPKLGNYFYTVIARHVERGRLVKAGGGYRLPNSSAQAETGAVAAPAPETAGQSVEAAHDGSKGNGVP